MEIVRLNSFEEIRAAFKNMNRTFVNLNKADNFDEYIQRITNYAKVFAIIDNGQCIAFAAVYMNDYQSKIGYITIIGVDPAYRGKGIGTKMLEYCEEQAKNAGMLFLQLEVKKENHIAQNYYLKFGYAFLDKESEKSRFMQKSLKSSGKREIK